MALMAEFERLCVESGETAAVAAIAARAQGGDAEALHLIGNWRLWGAFGPQDLVEGYGYVLAAAKAGDIDAVLTLSALLATGTGVHRDEQQARALIEAISAKSERAARQLRSAASAPTVISARQVLRADPLVARIDGLLSPDECRYLIEAASAKVQPSVVIDPHGRSVPNPIRDSHGMNFAPVDEDLVIHGINCRIAMATQTHWDQGEPLHVLRYEPGQQYRRHLDALPGIRNQRTMTCLVYLNDGFAAGETEFSAGLKVRGNTGDAVIFTNTDPHGRPDHRTQHAGLPVESGVKWLATRWIRKHRYHPWDPNTTG